MSPGTKPLLPGRVLIFTLRRLDQFFQQIVDRTFQGPHAMCSFWPNLPGINLQHEFYRHYRARSRVIDLSAEDYASILRRCRVMRAVSAEQGRRMIDAMYRVIDELTDRCQPDYLLSTMVDSYISDLFVRICRRKGIREVMIANGVTSDTILVTSYGEYVPARDPDEAEVDRVLDSFLDDKSTVTYALKQQAYNFRRHLKVWGRWWAKSCCFRAMALWHQDPLNYRWLVNMLPEIDGQSALSSYRCHHYWDHDWETRCRAQDSRPLLFLPLAHFPEASVEYWLDDLNYIDYENFVVQAAHTLSDSYRLVVKEHWSAQGLRRWPFYQRLKQVPGLTLVPAEVNSRRVMQLVDRVLIGTGTPGIEAALRGKKVAVLGPPYYYVEGSYLNLARADRIAQLPELLESFTPPANTRAHQRRLVRRMLEPTWRGTLCPLGTIVNEPNIAAAAGSLRDFATRLTRLPATRAAA